MLSILVLVGTLVAHPVAPPVAHFRLAVSPTATGYKIDCIEGCRWVDLTFACDADCRVIVDNVGVTLGAEPAKSANATFAFEFRKNATGWDLISLDGTHWRTLGFGCGESGCSAVVDEFGVRVDAVD